jgi:HEAT repeat protein
VSAIRRALDVRPDETRVAGSTFSLCLVVNAGQAIGLSAVTSLFLEHAGSDALPTAYLLQGVAAFAVMLLLTAALGRVSQRRAFLVMSGALVAVVTLERALLIAAPGWIYQILWATVAIAVIVQSVYVWGVAGRVTDARQAKRLFPLFAGGGIAGAVVGGLATVPLASIAGTANLLTIWIVTLVAADALGRTLLTGGERVAHGNRNRHASVSRELRAAARYVGSSPLLVWMTIAAVLFSVLFYSLFLPFASSAAARYPDSENLAGFIGVFSAATTAGAFLLSTFATNRIFTRFGVALAVLVLPTLYVGAFGTLLATSAFAMLVAGRAVTGVWLQGVASPGWEALTNVVPDARRDQVRAFLNGGPAQAGTAIAGLIALAGTNVVSPRILTAIGLLTAVATVIVVWRIKRSYASALGDALHAGRPVFATTATRSAPFELEHDGQALATVLDAADDPSASVRRFAVELLSDVADDRADAAIERALGDADAAVAASAAAILVSRRADAPAADRLYAFTEDPDPAVRAAALTALRDAPAKLGVPLAERALPDPEAAVRAAALRTLVELSPTAAVDAAVSSLGDTSARVRHVAAEACARIGDQVARELIAALGVSERREGAIEALAAVDVAAHRDAIDRWAESWRSDAVRDRASAAAVPSDGDVADLLRAALLERARRSAILALRARSIVNEEGVSMRAAIADLDTADRRNLAMVLETLDALDPTARPLLSLWDGSAHAGTGVEAAALQDLGRDPDPFVATCAEYLERGGDDRVSRDTAGMPLMERVLFLRHVTLFDALATADLLPIAGIAEDLIFDDGELLGTQGETGDGLHIVVAGSVDVEADGATIAARGPGEVVGEMSLITHRPRMASMRARGDVRTLWISRRAFEGMIHDRPDVAIGVMHVLADRLAER